MSILQTFVKRLKAIDEDDVVMFAFFAFPIACGIVLAGICLCCLFALYKAMYMILSPMLWAVLVGTVLFPFKKNVTTVIQGWLTELQENNTPLVVGVLAVPLCALEALSEKVYTTAMSTTGLQIVCAYMALKMLTYGRTFAYVIGFLGRLYGYIDGFIVFFSEAWVFPLMNLYFCAYAAWFLLLRSGTVNKKAARVLLLPLWIYVLSSISLYFGVFKAAVFSVCSVVVCLLSAGAWAMDEPKSPEEDTTSKVPLDKALRSDSLIRIVAGLCASSWMVRHDSALLFIAIPFFIATISRIGSSGGFFSAVSGALNSLWSKVYPPIKNLIDMSVAGSLRKFVKVLFNLDQMLASSLHEKMDVISSVVVMGFLAFFALLTLLFVGFQLHNETVHIIRLSSSMINFRPDWLSLARNSTEDKFEDHDIDIDEYVQQGYDQGRAWLASHVRSLVTQDSVDSVRADMLEKQVMQIVGNLYKMLEEINSIAPTTASPEVEVRVWKAQPMSVTDLRALKEEITLIAKENFDTLMGVPRSVWLVLSVNLTFVLSLMGVLAGILFSFGMDIFNTIIEVIVFLTMVYYLLSTSKERWLPVQWFGYMAKLVEKTSEISDDSSSTAEDGQSPPVMEFCITGAIEQAIFGFLVTLKMAIFYGLYTYFVYSLFDLNIVLIPCLLAALFAAIPIVPPYIVAIFGFLELWLVRDALSVAIVFAVMSFAPHMYVDAAFYREVKNSYPYVTGLSILGGMYWFGLQGAIIAPFILRTFLVVINVYMCCKEKRRMTAGEDVALSAPSLRDLSAGVLCTKAQIQDVVLKMHLPLPISHSLFNKKKEEWQRSKEPVAAEALRAWCDSSRLPLSHLDLTGADLTDTLLADLLEAHQNGITQLDLTNVKGISDETNTLLDQRNVTFPNLRSLKMTSMELLSRPPPRRKIGVASMDTRNIPVLGEEDLEGAGGLDQMRENRGGPSHLMHSNQQSIFEGCSSSFNGGIGISLTEPVEEKIVVEEEREPPVFTSRCPNVTSLALPKVRRFPEDEENSPNDLLRRVFEPLEDLRILDLSYWTRMEDLRCVHPLHLTTLILYDVPDLYRTIDSIITLTELRFLDLSQSSRDTGLYPRPVTALHKLVTNLKHLTCLDISSTNLAAQPSPKDWPVKPDMHQGNVRSDIVGLRFLSKPLDFIGLFNCENASHFGEIPAKHISGDANEDQIIMALQMYKDRAGLLQSVLNESYQLYRFGNSNPLVRHTEALHLVLNAMQNHLEDSTLQIAGSASLFYIIRKVAMNRDTKKRVVSALLSGMETHMEEQVMVRNCCLSLCQFEIPQEILFDYSRLAILLVTVLQHHNADNLTQRIVVFLLNSMACHVEGDQKVQVGSFGAIEMILDQIRRKLATNMCDDVMEVGWSFLWNITDETPVNCERFLKADGLLLFHKCFDAFRNERELVRNMMGLIGNIAEVDGLRSQLMNDDYVKIFSALLDLVEDSIEISYNSAGVLAHMVSDGEEAWSGLTVRREQVMASVVKATEAWRLDTRRFINYRSFRPILRLLPLWHAYASQHWAVWALANLTTTDGAKYCAYVTDEGGIPLLQELVSDPRTTEPVRCLAKMVLDNIESWRTLSERERMGDGDLMVDSMELMDTS